MAAATSEKFTTMKDYAYDTSLEVLAKVFPFTSTATFSRLKNGEKENHIVNFAFMGQFTGEQAKQHAKFVSKKHIYGEWKCITCMKRMEQISTLCDRKGAVFTFNDREQGQHICTSEANAAISKISDFYIKMRRYNSNYNWTLRPVASSAQWSIYIDEKNTSIENHTQIINSLKSQINSGINTHSQKQMAIQEKVDLEEELDTMKKEISMLKSYGNLTNRYQGSYEHYYLDPSNICDNSVNLNLLDKAFKTYTPLLISLFDRHEFRSEMAWEGMKNSLELVIEIFESVDYGLKLVPCSRWFLDCFNRTTTPFYHMSLSKKMDFIGKAITSAPISNGANGSAVITFYHQINKNVINLLDSAKDKQSMKKMVKERLSPNNYQQKTALPSKASIEIAREKLGHFTTSLMTTEILETYKHAIKVDNSNKKNRYGSSSENEKSIYDMVRSKSSKHEQFTNTAAGFASRASSSNSSTKLPFVTKSYDASYEITMTDLIENIKNGNIWKLEVEASRLPTNAYVAECSLARKKMIFDHPWLFLNHQPNRFPNHGIVEVTHLVPIIIQTHTNCIFIIKGARKAHENKPITSHCCLPEFLSTEYHQCKSVFKEIGLSTGISVPTSGELAFGFGLSVSKGSSRLYESCQLYINGSHESIHVKRW